MKNKLYLSVIVFVFLLFSTSAKPISKESAKWWGFGTGAVTGTIASLATYGIMEIDGSGSVPLAVIVGAGVGALFGYLIYSGCINNTPEKRFEWAKKEFKTICSDSLIDKKYHYDEQLIRHIYFRFGTSWPLVKARSQFEYLRNRLYYASQTLRQAYDEAKKDSNLYRIAKKCKKLKKEMKLVFSAIEEGNYFVVQDDNYHFQVRLYEKHVEKQRRLEHERIERDRDRQEKKDRHRDRIRQKEKDRRQKANFLSGHRDNVNVNVNL